MKLALHALLLSVAVIARGAIPLPEAQRLAVVAARVEVGCRPVEEGLAQPNPQPSVRRVNG